MGKTITILVRRGESQIPIEVDAGDLLKSMLDQALMAKHMGQDPNEPVRGLEDGRSFYDLAVDSLVNNAEKKKD